jgi:hypothetical protein
VGLFFTGNKMQTSLHKYNIILMVWTTFDCMERMMVLKEYIYYCFQMYFLTPAKFLVH